MPERATLETYRYIFDNVNDAIFVHDLRGQFLDVNQVACQRLGYTREELLALNVQQIDAPEFATKFAESIPALVANKSVMAETCHIAKGGRRIPSEVSARFIVYQGRQGVLSVVRDITERKRAEAQITELQEQVASLAIRAERERLGHELHDGIGQVLGFIGMKAAALSDLLRAHEVVAAQAAAGELAQVAQTAYADVREAILGLRAMVAPDVGLETALREYVHRYRREWDIAVELEIAENVPTRFSPAAEIQLLRIIQEALTNVRQHAQARSAVVRFERREGEVAVIVQDHGIGFDPAQSRPERFGLQTMRERAQAFDGRLEVTSAPGAGTLVCVRVPPQALRSGE